MAYNRTAMMEPSRKTAGILVGTMAVACVLALGFLAMVQVGWL